MQVLPIPELMPFRLTRQMTGALQPHDALALLQPPCTLVMTALRSGKDILEVHSPLDPPALLAVCPCCHTALLPSDLCCQTALLPSAPVAVRPSLQRMANVSQHGCF